jgi:hypothetical protein
MITPGHVYRMSEHLGNCFCLLTVTSHYSRSERERTDLDGCLWVNSARMPRQSHVTTFSPAVGSTLLFQPGAYKLHVGTHLVWCITRLQV